MLAALLAIACLLGATASGVEAAAARTPPPTPTPTASPQPQSPAETALPAGGVTVIGAPGLRWSDLDPKVTPTLWGLAGESGLAAMSVRTALPAACPLDGWLTLNSGARSVAPRPDGDCATIPTPERHGDATRIPGWDALKAANEPYSYEPAFGTLGRTRPQEASNTAGQCAVGPGAAVALADAGGSVQGTYAADLTGVTRAACSRLLVVDAGGALSDVYPASRAAEVREIDDRVGRALAVADPDGHVLVAGLSDNAPAPTHLNTLIMRGNAGSEDGFPGWLHAESTRQRGLVQLTDLTATALSHLGARPADSVGSVLQNRDRSAGTADAVRDLADLDVAAQVVRTNFVPFFAVLIAGQLLAYAAVVRRLRRGTLTRERAARAVRGIGLGFGSAPLATFLANLVPWRAAGHPAAVLWVCLVGFSLAVATIAATGPWRRHPFGPAGAVATLTVGVLAADVATGSRLQLTALYGLSPLVAGRFYGFGNVAFGVFAMAALLAAAWAGKAVGARRGPPAAALAVLAVGAAAVLVDGWPTFGADFGGVLALVPGVAILAFGVAGVRATPLRVLGVVGATVGIVAAIAVADWTRPADRRSHLGKFVQDVLDGDAGSVIARKAKANLRIFVDAPVVVVAAVPLTVLVLLALLRPATLRLHGLARAQEQEPALRTLLMACLGTAVLGFAVNDSGIIVPAVALTAAGPLVAALWAGIWAEHPVRPTNPTQ